MKSLNSTICVLLLLVFATSARAVDPARHISQYAHTAWRIQDGAFSGAPKVIAQTADGYLWIGTTFGLIRFDGVRFIPWTPPDGEQLPSVRINSLLAMPDGSLWVGTAAGLSRLQNNHLTNYPSEPGVVSAIIQARDGTLWMQITPAASEAGPLCQIIGNGMRCYGKAEGIPNAIYTPLVEDGRGNFWLGGDTALLRWRPDSSSVYRPSGLKSNAGTTGVEALAVDPDGSLWVGMTSSGPGLGLQRLTQEVLSPFRTPDFDSSSLEVQTMLLDHNNALWVGTVKQGIYRFHGGKVEHFGSADGLSSDYVFKFFEDREGNLWVVTSKGIDNFRDTRVATFSMREGLSTAEVNSVTAFPDGTVWAGGLHWLDILRPDGDSFALERKALSGETAASIFEDHTGRLWVGVDNTLTIYEDGRFRQITRQDGSPTGMIVGITEDVEHNIWVESKGPPMTLMRIEGLQVREEFPSPQVPAARRVGADPGGGLWLGLLNGDLARFQHGTTETFHFQHDPDSRVEQLTVNPDGSVLGATAFGLIGWRRGKQLTLTVRNGLPCDIIYGFVTDDRDDLWLYTQCGLVVIPNAEMQRWWEDPNVALHLRVFDAFDGVQPGRAPFGGAARSADGRLWFANGFMLQMIDPRRLTGNPLPPPVHVEEVIADHENYSPRDELRLPPLTRDLEIDYTALSFVALQKVHFRYKLEGRDTDWQEAGTRRQAFYSDLRPGDYRFRVIACNNEGVWNEEGAALSFSVSPAWYQTSWFSLLSVISGLLIVWGLYRLRVRQIARTLGAQFDERLAERTRLARELHDTFLQTVQGSKMVADDVLEQSGDPERMRRTLEQLSGWLGQATAEGRAALDSLRTSTTEMNDLAAAFRRATESCPTQGPLESTFSVVGDSRDLHPIVRDEVYRIGYEAIRNACVHSGAARLDVELRYEQDLSVRVSDDGRGIDPKVVEEGRPGHFGLQGMRERAARIGGKLTLISSATSGTEVKVVVPGGIVYQKTSAPRFKRLKSFFRL